MLISHELPLCLLHLSKEINDYEYCLPHLLDENEEYKKFFYKAKKEGRYIIMDNSLHELGKAYDTNRLLYWIKELEPNEFIIPDVWENKTQSIVSAKYWTQYKFPKSTTKVVVVQAQDYGEAVECVQIYKDLGYKKIAFSYGASYYNEISNHPNKDLGKALGRLQVISRLYNQRILTKFDRVHLLGCSSPFEFSLYKGIDCIESIDTSNPIMMALEGKVYCNSLSNDKPITNMNSSFYIEKHKVNIDLVLKNVRMFKEFIEL